MKLHRITLTELEIIELTGVLKNEISELDGGIEEAKKKRLQHNFLIKQMETYKIINEKLERKLYR